MINTELREKMSRSLQDIRADIPEDVEAFTTGQTTPGFALGTLWAQVDALGRVLEILLHDGRTRPDGSTIE